MLIVFIRGIILYILIVFCMRIMGKRQLGELQPSELVITVLMSNIATLPVEDVSVPMAMGVVPVLTLVCLDVILSHLSLKFRGIRRVVSGSPKIIISDGIINQQLLKDLRFSVDDLLESLRSMQVFDISEVQLAVVETTGKISVYQKKDYQPLTTDDLKMHSPTDNPPQLIIDNGKIIDNALKFISKDRQWLMQKLDTENMTLKEVFLCTADSNGKTTLIRKNGGRK